MSYKFAHKMYLKGYYTPLRNIFIVLLVLQELIGVYA